MNISYSMERQVKVMERLLNPCLTSLEKDTKILEVGCGEGFWLDHIRAKGFNVIGCDISRQLIKKARQKGHHACVGDALNLPFKDRSFDLIYLIAVLEYCGNYERAISEISRVLREGGFTIIEAPNTNLHRFFTWTRYLPWLNIGKEQRYGEYSYDWGVKSVQLKYPVHKLKKIFLKNHLVLQKMGACTLLLLFRLKLKLPKFEDFITEKFPLLGSYLFFRLKKIN